jgi:hypothetical protein
LGTYLTCPRKFKYSYIDKIKSETSPQAQRGLDFHSFAQHFFEHLIFINNTYFVIDQNFLDDQLANVHPDAVPLIANFIDFENNRWEICKKLRPENPQSLYLPLLREGKFVSDKLEQITIIDRLDLRPDGNYTLVEYKTEKFKNKGWKDTEFRRELMFQKTTLETCPEFTNNFKRDIVDFVVYFPEGNQIMNEYFNYRTATALKKSLDKMRTDIANANYKCIVQYFCRFCPYTPQYCDMEFKAK